METDAKRTPALALWAIWVGISAFIVALQLTLGRGLPGGDRVPQDALNRVVVFAASQVVVASVIRWRFIPRAPTLKRALILMVVGLALSEAVEFYGIFLLPPGNPRVKTALFELALLSAIQFMPLYARNGGTPSNGDDRLQ